MQFFAQKCITSCNNWRSRNVIRVCCNMSSLPQGWHGIPVPTRNGISSVTAATVPTTIRKKWNSPLSNEVPRSRLPAYKPSNLRLHKNPVNGTIPPRTFTKSSCPVPKSDVATSPPKPSPTKQYQTEIAKLKKELTTIKTENSILKVKVRRVDDENLQKSRQIEKLRVELKAAQKVESTNSKKSKDSELLLLRQKCLRLEGALKEKDLALKRLNNEASLKLERTISRNSITRLEVGDIEDAKQDKLNETIRIFGKTSSAGHAISRSNHSTKTEVAKLREMIHKLEKENQDLQQLVKDKGEEIRQLKMHLRSRTYVKSPQNSESKTTVKVNLTSKSEPVPNPSISSKPTFNTLKSNNPVPIQKPIKPRNTSKQTTKITGNSVKKTNVQNIPKTLPKMQNSLQKHDIVKKQKANILCNGIPKSTAVKRQVNVPKSVLPVTRPRKSLPSTKPVISNFEGIENSENNIADEVQKMRENIAAKRIQRSWRDHQKRNFKKGDHQNLQKALTFIVTSLKHHKLRKEKMNMLQKRKNISPRMKVDDTSIVEAVQTAAKNIWEKEIGVINSNFLIVNFICVQLLDMCIYK
ncbi:uncharacterized protein NPIL_120042 [Nephila pilipes]|uniref:Uncharacterized protein n=1 Tax=Nephila pilipes TaxID=299642 RepID=A0A8X6Q719_NEPPI|nr:uncharacterized protein NPIL_120042 [Nephila pilipes]